MLILLFSLLTLLFVSALLLWIWSPGKPVPITGLDGKIIRGSIAEKRHITINGARQGMFIKGRDSCSPVLLYVHGGMPDYFLTQRYPTGLENYFVVTWWEQRGSGISYQSNAPAHAIAPAQLVADVISMANYLRNRFRVQKVYLMAHSGGTFIAIKAAAQAPELFHAYIAVAQITDQRTSEKMAYDYMLQQYKKTGNRTMIKKLEAAPVTIASGTPQPYLSIRDKAMHQLGIGTMHQMRSVTSGIFLPSLLFREYTLMEKINLWRAKASAGTSIVWNDIMTTNLVNEVNELYIPVYFFHGVYDYTCSYHLAKLYCNQLKAPIKGFYTFHHSAHSPIFEEPGKVQRILSGDVLKGETHLAD